MEKKISKYLPDTPIRKAKELSPSSKLVLVFIKQHIGANSSCHVSTIKLAEETGYSRQTISNCIKELERMGWLTVERRNRKSSIYSLPPDKFKWSAEKKCVISVDNHVSNSLTTPCKPGLQEVILTKKENQELKALAGEPAKPNNLFSSLKSGKVEKLKSEKEIDNKMDNNVFTLESIWKSFLKDHEEKKYVPELSKVQRGQAKHFIQKIQPHKVSDVLPLILTNWLEFGRKVNDDYNSGYPSKPNVGFLLKYCGEAVNFYLTEQKRQQEKQACKERLASDELIRKEQKSREAVKKEKAIQEFKAKNIEVTLDNYDDFYKQGYISWEDWKAWEKKQFERMFAEQDVNSMKK